MSMKMQADIKRMREEIEALKARVSTLEERPKKGKKWAKDTARNGYITPEAT